MHHALSNKSHHGKSILLTRPSAASQPVREEGRNNRGFGTTHSPKAYSRDRSSSRTRTQQTSGDLVMPQLSNSSPYSPLASLRRRWTRILRLLWRETSHSQSHETDQLAWTPTLLQPLWMARTTGSAVKTKLQSPDEIFNSRVCAPTHK